jgi:phage tail sheath gpL-like
MPISFSNIPANLRIPLYWVEVDPSMAGLPTIRQPSLLVGTMNSDGTAVPDVPIAVGTQAQADEHYGIGSEMSRMFKAFFANNFANEVWGLGVAEPVGAVAASGTITVANVQTEAGSIHLYIGGQHISTNIGASDTKDQVALAIEAAINEEENLPVIAEALLEVVTLTCKWKGKSGDDIGVSLNYYGKIGGEELPIGLVLTLPATGFLTGGTGVPDFDNAIMNMGEQQFEYVCLPYTDSTSLLAWETEFGFADTGRWGWMRELFGHVFCTKRGTYSDLMLFGATRNSGVVSIMAIEMKSPTPVYEWTAAYCAKAQRALTNDPARPLQTLSFNSVLSAPLHDRFNVLELNSLAGAGLATQKTPVGTVPMISRETTTYQLNLYGFGDDAYELVTTLATLAKLIRNQRHAITTKFPRHKLANDGTRFGPGQAIITPGIAKAELIAQYRQDEYNGLVEDTRNFKRHLLVERDPNNPNRLNVLYPPDLINQLRIFAVLAQFRLQYDRGIDVEIIGQSGLTGVTARPAIGFGI